MKFLDVFWKQILVLILVFVSYQEVLAQSNKRVNIWYFGYNAGLDFNGGTPKPLTNGALNIWEGCATICDENGSLLFYTDGRYIWNKNHNLIPNASNLGGDNSSSQSGIIVPQPENPNIYFVFSVDAEGGSGGVQYAIVDITLNGGLGGIVSKNNRLLSRASEKLTAVRHCNNKDFWVISHELNNNSFRAFQVTKNGLSAASVESKIGIVHSGGANAIGYMKASSTGNKIAVCSWGLKTIELFNFDNSTGSLSNGILSKNDILSYVYGAEFSPNNMFLYISIAENKIIYQYEVNVANSAAFEGSRVEIGRVRTTGASKIGALQLAPNGIIYAALDNTSFLGVINRPDSKGTLCDFQEKGIELSGKRSGLGLPNSITSYFNIKPAVSVKSTAGTNCNEVTLAAEVTSKAPNLIYQWYADNKIIPGSDKSTFIPVHSGNYTVSVKEAGQCVNDSAQSLPVKVTVLEAVPQKVAAGCGSVQLKANANGPVKWFGKGVETSKATFDTITIFGSGEETYKVQVYDPSNSNCFIEKMIVVKFSDNQPFDFGIANLVACDTVTLRAPKSSVWNSYIWKLPDGSTINSDQVLARQTGKYVIAVKNTSSGCEAKDSISVQIGTAPKMKSNETICLTTNSVTLDADAAGSNLTYKWAPGGEVTSNVTVTSTGQYTVKATSPEGCSASRIFEISLAPLVDLGDDITACNGQLIDLKPTLTNITQNTAYKWSSGETTKDIRPGQSGIYKLVVKQGTCQAADSVQIKINALPKIKPDETICLNTVMEAGGLEPNLDFEWQHSGDTSRIISVSEDGSYRVKITNQYGCSLTRTITVDGPCYPRIFAADIFTPNEDNINDTFQVSVIGATIIQLDIFNRWGLQILKDTTAKPLWDGKFDGKYCPPGVYPYVLRYKSNRYNTILKHQGSVVLSR